MRLGTMDLRMMGVAEDDMVKNGAANSGVAGNKFRGQWMLWKIILPGKSAADNRATDDEAIDDGSANEGRHR